MSESIPVSFVSSQDQANKNNNGGLGDMNGDGASPTALDILATLEEELGPASADAYLDEDFDEYGGGEAKQGFREHEEEEEKDFKK